MQRFDQASYFNLPVVPLPRRRALPLVIGIASGTRYSYTSAPFPEQSRVLNALA